MVSLQSMFMRKGIPIDIKVPLPYGLVGSIGTLDAMDELRMNPRYVEAIHALTDIGGAMIFDLSLANMVKIASVVMFYCDEIGIVISMIDRGILGFAHKHCIPIRKLLDDTMENFIDKTVGFTDLVCDTVYMTEDEIINFYMHLAQNGFLGELAARNVAPYNV